MTIGSQVVNQPVKYLSSMVEAKGGLYMWKNVETIFSSPVS